MKITFNISCIALLTTAQAVPAHAMLGRLSQTAIRIGALSSTPSLITDAHSQPLRYLQDFRSSRPTLLACNLATKLPEQRYEHDSEQSNDEKNNQHRTLLGLGLLGGAALAAYSNDDLFEKKIAHADMKEDIVYGLAAGTIALIGFKLWQNYNNEIIKKEIIAKAIEREDPIYTIAQHLGHTPFHAGGYVFVSNSWQGASTEYDTYKIHLMPETYNLETIYDLLKTFNDIGLSKAVTIKFYRNVGNNHPSHCGENFPCVVIYAIGKEHAQKLLNLLYFALADIPGSGIQPRYNGKVTDLIWIAQGNGDYKKYRHEQDSPEYGIYEEPEAIYCRTDYPDPEHPRDHYLKHPETNTSITSGVCHAYIEITK